MRLFSFVITLGAMACGFLAPVPARAGLGTDLAVAGCSSVTSSMIATEVAVDPHHLTFTTFVGDESPASQIITVECYDYTDYYSPNCGASLTVDQPWLKLDRSRFYGADSVGVTVNPEGMEPGSYEGRIHLSYDYIAIDDTESVRVELIVEE